jgi:hypothetical protein
MSRKAFTPNWDDDLSTVEGLPVKQNGDTFHNLQYIDCFNPKLRECLNDEVQDITVKLIPSMIQNK